MSMLRRRLMMMQQGGGGVNPNTYIEFADANVAQLCASKWGDGTGLTYAQAAKVTDLSSVFRDNAVITSFDELQYFTSLASIGYAALRQCKLLEHVTLPESVTSLANYAMYRCYKLTDIDTCNAAGIGQHALRECSVLATVNCPNALTIGDSAFRMSGIVTLKLWAATSIAQYALYQIKKLATLVLGASTVCEASANGFMTNVPTSCKIYVPDALVDSYKATAPWSTRASQIYPLSEYVEQ